MNDEKMTITGMNITCPENSMNKMLCKPPLVKQFKKKSLNKLMPEIESARVETYICGMILLQRKFIANYKKIVPTI